MGRDQPFFIMIYHFPVLFIREIEQEAIFSCYCTDWIHWMIGHLDEGEIIYVDMSEGHVEIPAETTGCLAGMADTVRYDGSQ